MVYNSYTQTLMSALNSHVTPTHSASTLKEVSNVLVLAALLAMDPSVMVFPHFNI